MELPEELEDKLYLEILEMKGEKDMSFMTIVEKKGIEKGIIQGRQDAILILLNAKFQKPGKNVTEMIRKIQSFEVLDRLLEQANFSASLQEFTELLKKEVKNL